MNAHKVVFSELSLAEAYALTTLARYVSHRARLENLNLEVGFNTHPNRSDATKRLLEHQLAVPIEQSDVSVGIYFHKEKVFTDLLIDIALLKNCAPPMAQQEKTRAKKEAGINPSEKVFVVANLKELGYASVVSGLNQESKQARKQVISLMEEASKYATLAVFDDDYNLTSELSEQARNKVHLITQYGVLKKYSSFAEAVITGDRLGLVGKGIHNFFESTEHGLFFCIPKPEDYNYFGFNQMVSGGSIVPVNSLDSLEEAVVKHLKSDGNVEKQQVARAAHIQQTRDLYLPVMMNLIKESLDRNPIDGNIEHLKSISLQGLRLSQLASKQVVLYHPSSTWPTPAPIVQTYSE